MKVTDEMIELAAKVHAPFLFEKDDGKYIFPDYYRDEARKEVREILEAALNPPEQT